MLGLQTCPTLPGSSQSSIPTIVGPLRLMMVVGGHWAGRNSAKGPASASLCRRPSSLWWHDVWVQRLPSRAVCWVLPVVCSPFCLRESTAFCVLPGQGLHVQAATSSPVHEILTVLALEGDLETLPGRYLSPAGSE